MLIRLSVALGMRSLAIGTQQTSQRGIGAVPDLLKPTGLNSLQFPSTNLSPRARMKPTSTPAVGTTGGTNGGTAAGAGAGVAAGEGTTAGVSGSSAGGSTTGGASAGASAGASPAAGSIAANSAAAGDVEDAVTEGLRLEDGGTATGKGDREGTCTGGGGGE